MLGIMNDIDDLEFRFDQKADQFSCTLDLLESKYHFLHRRLNNAEGDSQSYADRLSRAEQLASRLRAEQESYREREELLRNEISRLELALENERLQSSMTELKMSTLLAEERLRSERLKALRDDAMLHRDKAMSELASAYAKMDGMKADALENDTYIRYLGKQLELMEVEVLKARIAAESQLRELQLRESQRREEQSGTVFSLAAVKTSIQAAVQEAIAAPEEEKRRKLRALQLRWHPDKNPVLTEFATEVSKLINEAVAEAEKSSGVAPC